MSAAKKPLLDLREIHEISGTVLSVIGIAQNLLLLYLILFKTGTKLKSYKKILLQNCIVDTLYNITNGLIKVAVDARNGNFYLIMSHAFGQLPSPLSNYLIAFWVFAIFYCMTSLPVQFIYRYYMIVRDKRIEGCTYAALVFVAFATAFSYGTISLFSLWQPPMIHAERGMLLRDDPYYYNEDLVFVTGDIRNWFTMCHIFYATVLTNSTYTIIGWTGYKVWRHLQVIRSQMSTQTRDIHNQMNKALILQAMIPFCTCLLPIGITIPMIVLRTNVNGLGVILSLTFSWIPLANSLTTIYVVKSYRKIVIQYIKALMWRMPRVEPQTSTDVATK